MSKISFNQSVEGFFFERLDQLNPRKVSKEYFDLSEKHYSLFNELKDNLPGKLQKDNEDFQILKLKWKPYI